MTIKNSKANGKIIAAILLVVGSLALALMAYHYVRHRMAYAVTDAVFVATDTLTTVGFDRVGGLVVEISKREGDPVKINEILAQLDDGVYRLEVDRLDAELEAARRRGESLGLLLARQKQEFTLNKEIASAHVAELEKRRAANKARVQAMGADIAELSRDSKRFSALYKAKAVARRRTEAADANLAIKTDERSALQREGEEVSASLQAARLTVQLVTAKERELAETKKGVQAQDQAIKGLTAARDKAQSDLESCSLKSPINGVVAKRYLSPGAIVSSRSVVLALVNPKDIHLVALLEENKLGGVEPGAKASIHIDAYPDQEFSGEVSTVFPASAATFALAPRDISAGEFTKVAQRIPVRISLTKGDLSLLRVGLSGEVEIKRLTGGS